jgi:hypothetical protein
MCPNCLNSIAMALGGGGSAALLALTSLRFRTARARKLAQPNIEETAS